MLIQESNVSSVKELAASDWFRHRGFTLHVNHASSSSQWGVATAVRDTWLGRRSMVSRSIVDHHIMRSEIFDPGELECSLAVSNVYLKSGSEPQYEDERTWQLDQLRRSIPPRRPRISTSKFRLAGSGVEIMAGDWNFVQSKGDRWVLAKDGREGHWSSNVGHRTQTGRAFDDMLPEFCEVHQEFLTLKAKTKTHLGKNDRFYTNLTLSARTLLRMKTTLLQPPGDLSGYSDHGAVGLLVEVPHTGRALRQFPVGVCHRPEFEASVYMIHSLWKNVPLNAWTRERLLRITFWEIADALVAKPIPVTDPLNEMAQSMGLLGLIHFGPTATQTNAEWIRAVNRKLLQVPKLAVLLTHIYDTDTERWSFEWDASEVDEYIKQLAFDAAAKAQRLEDKRQNEAEQKFSYAHGDRPKPPRKDLENLKKLKGNTSQQWQAIESEDCSEIFTECTQQVAAGVEYWDTKFRDVPDLPGSEDLWNQFWGSYAKVFPNMGPPDFELFCLVIRYARSSAPGVDGIPLEAWKATEPVSAAVLDACFQEMACMRTEAERQAEMPPTFNKQRLALVLKKVFRHTEDFGTIVNIKDTRSISIGNHSKRLIARGVTHVVTAAAHDFLDSAQYMLRSIIENVVRSSAALESMRRRRTRGGLGCLDMLRAFPSLHWQFLMRFFEKVQMPPWFTRYYWSSMHRCYHEFSRNGATSVGIFVLIGVLQGDPLAMIIYALAADVVNYRMRMALEPGEFIFVWADDTSLALRCLSRLITMLELLHFLSRFTNLRPNRGKGEWIMAHDPCSDTLDQWLIWAEANGWDQLPLVYTGKQLGVPIGRIDPVAIFRDVVGAMYRALREWQCVNTSPGAKIQIINTFINSKPAYLQQFYEMPRSLMGPLQMFETCFVFGLPLCEGWLTGCLSQLGMRHEVRLLETQGIASMLRAQHYATIGLSQFEIVPNPVDPHCIPDIWACVFGRFHRKFNLTLSEVEDTIIADLPEWIKRRNVRWPNTIEMRKAKAKKKYQSTIAYLITPEIFDNRSYWRRRTQRLLDMGVDFGALMLALERESTQWCKTKCPEPMLIAVLRLVLNGLHTDARHQNARDPPCFLCERALDRTEHFIECAHLNLVAWLLGLVRTKHLEQSWFISWINGQFAGRKEIGPHLREQRKLSWIFPLFVHAVYTHHNMVRHGREPMLTALDTAHMIRHQAREYGIHLKIRPMDEIHALED